MTERQPTPLEQLVQRLLQSDLDVSVAGVLDACWLALQPGLLAQPGEPAAPAQSDRKGSRGRLVKEPRQPSPARESGKVEPPSSPGTAPGPSSPPPLRPAPTKADVFSSGAASGDTDTLPASPLRIPAATALADKLPLSRSLRPLRRRYRDARMPRLDEEATVDETARAGGILVPIVEPSLERWYELVIVADAGASMDVWHETLLEFEQMSRAAGVFRDIRRVRLAWKPSSSPNLAAGACLEKADGQAIAAATLAQTNIRRVVFLMTNGSGPHWTSGAMAELLATWSKQCSVAIVHMLPPHLWPRTRTGEPKLLLRTLSPGAVTATLDADALWWDDDLDDGDRRNRRIAGAVPMMPLDPEWMHRWARMQMGGGNRVPGIIVGARAAAPPERNVSERTPAQWEQTIRAFTMHSSAEARTLAVCLSSGPFTLPVARLVQAVKIGAAASHTQLAELLLSGLVQRTTPAGADLPHEWVEYRIHPPAAAILRRGLREADSGPIAEALARHIERHWGKPVDFRALVYDERGQSSIPQWAQPFVKLGNALLRLPVDPEPADHGEPTVFILTDSPRWHGLANELAVGLTRHGLRVLLSGTHKVPATGVVMAIAAVEPLENIFSEDHARASYTQGLGTLWLLPPGHAIPTFSLNFWQQSWDTLSRSDNPFEELAEDIRRLDKERRIPRVSGAPPLDWQRGFGGAVEALRTTLARNFGNVVVYSSDEFRAAEVVGNLVWHPGFLTPFVEGGRWLQPGDTYAAAPNQLLVFDRPTAPVAPPTGSVCIIIDPEFQAVAHLRPQAVFEGNDEVKRRAIQRMLSVPPGDPPSEAADFPVSSPHLTAVMVRLTASSMWPLIRAQVVGTAPESEAPATVVGIERFLRRRVFNALPSSHLEVLGGAAAVRDRATLPSELRPLIELDLVREDHDALTPTPIARLFAREHPQWPVWNLQILDAHQAWDTNWHQLATSDDYFRRNVIFHTIHAQRHEIVISILCDFRYWVLRLTHDGAADLGGDLLELPEGPQVYGHLKRFWTTLGDVTYTTAAEIARRIVQYDGELPTDLRTSASSMLTTLEAQPLPAPVPNRFVLVAGARGVSPSNVVKPAVLLAARAIGVEIARRGFGLVCGAQPGCDHEVLRAFVTEMGRRSLSPHKALRVVTFERDLHGLELPAGLEVELSPHQVIPSVQAANAVVLLGGANWVRRVFHEARLTGRAAYPMASSGEASGDIFHEEVAEGRLKADRPWARPVEDEQDAAQVASALLEEIAALPPAATVPRTIWARWRPYLDAATDSAPLFDYRKAMPRLRADVLLTLLHSGTIERLVALAHFLVSPSPNVANVVFTAAVASLRSPSSLTERYLSVAACNKILLGGLLFPAYEVIEEAGPLLRGLQLPTGPSRRAQQVRHHVRRLQQQLEIVARAHRLEGASVVAGWTSGSAMQRLVDDLSALAPPHGHVQLVYTLNHPWVYGLRLYAYARLTRTPDKRLVDALLGCLLNHEDQAAGFVLGLRALQAIAGQPGVMTGERRGRLKGLRPRLQGQALEALNALVLPQSRTRSGTS